MSAIKLKLETFGEVMQKRTLGKNGFEVSTLGLVLYGN
jgi:hypothetical protein